MGCDKPQADDLDQIEPQRLHLVGEVFDLGLAAGLVVTDDEHPVFQSQRRDLRKRDMAMGQPISLDAAFRIKIDEVGAADRIDQQFGPGRPQGFLSRHLVADKERIRQDSAGSQREQRIGARGAARCELCQLVEQVRSQMTEFVRLAEIVEMPGPGPDLSVCAAQAEAYGELPTRHEVTKQRELSEVADSADMPALHKTPRE